MDEKVFEGIRDNFQKAVCDDIAYTYGVFVPKDTKNILSKMKSNISLQEERFLEPRLKKELGGKSVSPYDILIPKLKKHINDFYDEFRLSLSTLEKLSQYGQRSDVFKKHFQENLEKSKATTTKTILGELELQIARGNDVKSVISHMQNILSTQATALRQTLEQGAGQMKQYMVLWDYQDKGFTNYRLRTNADNCKSCTALEGKIFSISEAEVGINLAPLHPNCDCTAEIVDNQGNTVFTLDEKAEPGEPSKTLEYLHDSLKQVVLGNFSENTNLLGTLGQIVLGLTGLDLPADFRDLFYDITNWETSPGHILQTLLDAVALFPILGSIKYTDEAADLLEAAAKHGDEATDAVKTISKTAKTLSVSDNADIVAKKYGLSKHGYFGEKGKNCRIIKSDDPINTSADFYREISKGGIESTLPNGKGVQTYFSDSSHVEYRIVTKTPHSPAIEITISTQGNIKTQKIHFVKDGE